MWFMCSKVEKAPTEKVQKKARKNSKEADEASGVCQTFSRCLPEEQLEPASADNRDLPVARDKLWKDAKREDSISTRASSKGSEPTTPMIASKASPDGPKVDKIRLEKNLKKVRRCVRDVVGHLNHFQVWMKRQFNSPVDCFETIVGDSHTKQVELDHFVYYCQVHGFKGKPDKVFYGLCDQRTWSDVLVITQEAFVKRMNGMGLPLKLVIRQAVAANQKKIQQRLAKMRKDNLKQQEIDQLLCFRKFLEPLFDCPEKVFDDIAGDDGCVDEDEFVTWLAGHKYPGDGKKVFQCFCDQDGVLARFGFSELLISCKKLTTTEGDVEVQEGGQREHNVKESSSNQEASQAARAGRLSRSGTQSLSKAGVDEPPNPDASRARNGDEGELKRVSRSRRRSNTITSVDSQVSGDGDEGELKRVSRSRRRSNTTTSMDSQVSGKVVQRSKRRSKSITSMDGDPINMKAANATPADQKGPKSNRVRSKSWTPEDGPTILEQLNTNVNEDSAKSAKSKAKASAKTRASRSGAVQDAQPKAGGVFEVQPEEMNVSSPVKATPKRNTARRKSI